MLKKGSGEVLVTLITSEHLRKCIERRMENLHTDARVSRVNNNMLCVNFF